MVYISVIITAYNRKQYLYSAINSVLNQTLDKKYYELIVIKNFNDNKIDELIQKNGIKSIYINEKSLSIKISKGLNVANGEIISFLDDDDQFSSNKLEYIYNIFQNEKINYYHNDASIITESGDLVRNKKLGIFVNLSCISIRKRIIMPCVLNMVNRGIDIIMFLFALEHGGILEDKNKLTLYRLHDSVSHLITKNFLEYKNFELLTLDDTITDFTNIKSKFKNKNSIDFINAFLTSLIIKKYILQGINYKIPNLRFFISCKYFSFKSRSVYVFIIISLKINKYLTLKIISKLYEKFNYKMI
ncbi:glycosyltransferase family 2 protein [Acidiplasma aeolicum]|jgi:glycosyltransferase involved in cell wall biosynthesis|uniref:glycosyltransferase family 2 protein n=1 Tax=Acidiplasma aeolicum TaxID=507754 RepID=UPI00371D4DE2